MKTYLDCIPCILRGSIINICLSTKNEALHEEIINEIFLYLAQTDFRLSPPYVVRGIHKIIKERTGCEDPYKELKAKYNKIALDMVADLKKNSK